MRKIIVLAGMLFNLYGCAFGSRDAFFVEHAQLSEIDRKTNIQTEVADLKPKVREITYAGHRVSKGTGLILALREFSAGNILITDQAVFKKITVFISGVEELESGSIVRFGSNEITAFLSHSSSSFPGGNGCYGYATKGSIFVKKINAQNIAVRLDLIFDQRSPGDWTGECLPTAINESFNAHKKSISSLTPWDGRQGNSIYDETMRP